MNKNAFTILDFLGYFFPGAVLICAAYYFKLPGYEVLSHLKGETTSGLIYVICFILSYILGHIIAMMSSVTVEKYANWRYGYPSYFLINDYERGQYFQKIGKMKNHDVKSYSKREYKSSRLLVRVFMLILLLPISILDCLLSKFIGMDYYYTRKFDYQIIQMVKVKTVMLYKKLNIYVSDKSIMSSDYHRIIHNHYYEKNKEHSRRMDNCIAIYDFLRAIAFIFAILTLVLVLKGMGTFNIHASVDWLFVYRVCLFGAISYISYMGFLKFYRKFAVENLMCLICDDDLEVMHYSNNQESPTSVQGSTDINNETVTLN